MSARSAASSSALSGPATRLPILSVLPLRVGGGDLVRVKMDDAWLTVVASGHLDFVRQSVCVVDGSDAALTSDPDWIAYGEAGLLLRCRSSAGVRPDLGRIARLPGSAITGVVGVAPKVDQRTPQRLSDRLPLSGPVTDSPKLASMDGAFGRAKLIQAAVAAQFRLPLSKGPGGVEGG